jgi:plasmid replication initiation protein
MDSNNKKEDKLAVQHNDLVFGQQSFSLLQKRLYLLAVAQIEKDDDELKPYKVQISDLVNSGTSRDIYNRLDGITDQLGQKLFKRRWIEDGKRVFEKWPMIDYAKHKEGQNYIEIAFNHRMKELLLQLKENFTPVSVLNQRACKSVYGQRIYEMLYSWRQHSVMEISLKDLKKALNIEDKYETITGFRNKVLKKAQSDLKEHTNIEFTWKELKKEKGKKITHIRFHFVVDENPPPLKLKGNKVEKSKKISLNFNLSERLKSSAELTIDKRKKIELWLAENIDQQLPLAHWLHQKIEVPEPPVDSLGNPIRDIQAWTWGKIKKAMKTDGFPSLQKTPKSNGEPSFRYTGEPETVEKNNFLKEMRERIGKD